MNVRNKHIKRLKVFIMILFLITLFVVFILISMGETDRSKYREISTATALTAISSVALKAYKEDFGRYLTTEEGLAKLVPVYLPYESSLLDKWGEPYIYISPDPDKGKDSFILYSKGPNQLDEKGLGDDIVCCQKK